MPAHNAKIKKWFPKIESFLDRKIDEQANQYVAQYATREDGSVDEPLAQRIQWEVRRRGEAGKQLDIYEPIRWNAIHTVLGIVGAGVAKVITNKLTNNNEPISRTVAVGLVIATLVNSVIDLVRLYPRWLAGAGRGQKHCA